MNRLVEVDVVSLRSGLPDDAADRSGGMSRANSGGWSGASAPSATPSTTAQEGFSRHLERLITYVKCIECGDELVAERAELGYQYCTKKQCQDKHHKGLTITAIGVNKSADTFIVGDQEDIRRRAEAGEFAKKDSGLGINYRTPQTGIPPTKRRPNASPNLRQPTRRPWTSEQEKIVRLYHGMGLTPQQIAERARENTPRLGITESLAIKIICSPPTK